jgi:hypothetical protein
VSEKPESAASGAEKRRSTRVLHSAAITVKGTDALGLPFRESTKTVMVNCYGCLYQAIRYPAPGSPIMLEVRQTNPRRAPRVVPGRVIWVQRPKGYRALYHVGVEFEVAGNVWDITLPPEDWFPSPEDEELVVPSSAEESIANPNEFVLQAPVVEAGPPASTPIPDVESVFAASFADSRALQTLLLSDEKAIQSRANGARSDGDLREEVRMYAAETIAQEIVRIREFIQTELQNAIDRAVQHAMGRSARTETGAEASCEAEIDAPVIAASEETSIESVAAAIETSEPRQMPDDHRHRSVESAENAPSANAGEAIETGEELGSESALENTTDEAPTAASGIRPDPEDMRNLSARERRAAKRARKMQKTTP